MWKWALFRLQIFYLRINIMKKWLYCPWELMTCQTSCVLSAGILCSEYWLKYSAAKTGPWQTKSSFWLVRCGFSVRPEVIQGWLGRADAKQPGRGHTLCSRKINKVNNKTGGRKPPDTNLFLAVYAHFLQFYPVFSPCFLAFFSLCPFLICVCVCARACVRAFMYLLMFQKLTRCFAWCF